MEQIERNTSPNTPKIPPRDEPSSPLRRFSQAGKRYLEASTEILLETLWPTRCALCDSPGPLLCDACRLNLPYIDHWRSCKRCGGPQGAIQCSECNPVILKTLGRKHLPFDSCVSVVSFDTTIARLISTYKDKNEQYLGDILAQLMVDTFPPSWLSSLQRPVISYIPATAKAFRRRGFDHAESLARHIALSCDLPLENLLERPNTQDQRDLSRKGRISNMEDRFRTLNKELPDTVLLIDDVYTTGSTLCSASDALLGSGVKTVLCATFARVW